MKSILIIEDDISIGNMLEEVLKKNGYNVFRAYSGTEAVLVLKTVTPDLVLLDLMLPGLSGEEVFSGIQGIPVIIMSAKLDMENNSYGKHSESYPLLLKSYALLCNRQQYLPPYHRVSPSV